MCIYVYVLCVLFAQFFLVCSVLYVCSASCVVCVCVCVCVVCVLVQNVCVFLLCRIILCTCFDLMGCVL